MFFVASDIDLNDSLVSDVLLVNLVLIAFLNDKPSLSELPLCDKWMELAEL